MPRLERATYRTTALVSCGSQFVSRASHFAVCGNCPVRLCSGESGIRVAREGFPQQRTLRFQCISLLAVVVLNGMAPVAAVQMPPLSLLLGLLLVFIAANARRFVR